jgi:hypothetical protein
MSSTLDDIVKSAKSGFTTSVGLGLLVFQQAQVQRRQLERAAGQTVRTMSTALDERLKLVEERVSDLAERTTNHD